MIVSPTDEIVPPTLRELLTIPAYEQYFSSPPVMPHCVELRNPWQVWGRKYAGGWASKICPEYPVAYNLTCALLTKTDTYSDVCLVSRSVLHPCPIPLRNLWPQEYEWCARCRRPTVYQEGRIPRRTKQRNIAGPVVVTTDEPYRCYYCGARRFFASLYVALPVKKSV